MIIFLKSQNIRNIVFKDAEALRALSGILASTALLTATAAPWPPPATCAWTVPGIPVIASALREADTDPLPVLGHHLLHGGHRLAFPGSR